MSREEFTTSSITAGPAFARDAVSTAPDRLPGSIPGTISESVIKEARFPQEFLWGAATSGHQIDGGNDKSDWWAWEAEGHDLTFTSGELYTNPALHGPSKVAGEVRFVLDFRSISDETMRLACAKLREAKLREE